MRSAQGVGCLLAVWIRWIQSCSACFVALSSVTDAHGVFRCFVTSATMGDSNPLPLGMPMAACVRRPWMRCRSRTRALGRRISARRSCVSDVIFSLGSVIVRASPSKSHPRISFCVAHSPSPCANFLSAIGSSLWDLVMAAGGKMWCIAWRIALVRCRSWCCVGAWMSAMKSST